MHITKHAQPLNAWSQCTMDRNGASWQIQSSSDLPSYEFQSICVGVLLTVIKENAFESYPMKSLVIWRVSQRKDDYFRKSMAREQVMLLAVIPTYHRLASGRLRRMALCNRTQLHLLPFSGNYTLDRNVWYRVKTLVDYCGNVNCIIHALCNINLPTTFPVVLR